MQLDAWWLGPIIGLLIAALATVAGSEARQGEDCDF